MVAVSWKGALQHVTHNLHQVKGRMHGSEKPLPCLFCHIDDARTSVSCKDVETLLVLMLGIQERAACFIVQDILGINKAQ